MNDSLEYIEAYFEKQLDGPAMRQFERQCEQDADFARDVALYITTREAMRLALVEQKREQWRPLSEERRFTLRPASPEADSELPSLPEDATAAEPAAPSVRRLIIRRWLPVAAAASLLLFVVTHFYNSGPSFGTQVAGIIQEELLPPSSTMGIPDTLERARSAYEKKDYNNAILYYSAILQADSLQDQALLYKGRSFLALKKYDSALHYFDKLSIMELASNSGPFDAALTLLVRKQKGDQERAQTLLQQVADDKGSLEGKEKARDLLDRMR